MENKTNIKLCLAGGRKLERKKLRIILREMKKHQLIIILLFLILLFSCKEKSDKNLTSEIIENTDPKVNIRQLQTDFIKWRTSHQFIFSKIFLKNINEAFIFFNTFEKDLIFFCGKIKQT